MDHKEEKDHLKRIKKNVETSYLMFKANYDRYQKFQRFLYADTVSEGERSVNSELLRNNLQFNVIEGYVSRYVGQFAEHEPGIEISSTDDYMPPSEQEMQVQNRLIETLTGHMRHIINQSNGDGMECESFRCAITGGYSAFKLAVDYIDERSFLQGITLSKVYDETLIGFDPLAERKDKLDGNYCFSLVPLAKDDAESYLGIKLDKMKFPQLIRSKDGEGNTVFSTSNGQPTFGPYAWAWKANEVQMLLLAEYYEKKKVRKSLVWLTDNRTMLESEYNDMIREWDKYELPPAIKERRMTEITKIVRYRIIENKIVDEVETDFPCLPLIFIDGNSVMAKDENTGSIYQMTRPIHYQAIDAQRLKNYSGQCIGNELENMRPQTIVASIQSVPEEYREPYRNPQNTTTLFYESFYQGNPAFKLDPPILAPRNPIPPEILQTFTMCDSLIQHIMGSGDGNAPMLGPHDVSGKAMELAISLTDNAVKPFMKNYLTSFQSACQAILDMLPLIYATERTIPIIDKEGRRSYVTINAAGDENENEGVKFNYEPGQFKIKLEAGLSFAMQKKQAREQLTGLMQVSPEFNQFMNSAGLDILVDNLELKGHEVLKERTSAWMQQKAAAEQQAMQAQMNQPNMEQMAMEVAQQQVSSEYEVGMARVQAQMMSDQAKTALKAAEIENSRDKMLIELSKVVGELQIEMERLGIERQKSDDDRVRKIIDAAIAQSTHKHDLADKHMERALRAAEREALKVEQEDEQVEHEAQEYAEDLAGTQEKREEVV